MAGFRLEYTFDDGSCVELDGNVVKFWVGYGLPDFEGDMDGFAKCFPNHLEVLINKRVIRVK